MFSLSSSVIFDIVVFLLLSKKYLIMEKKHFQSFDQYGEILFENYIDWSISLYKDDVSRDEENLEEPSIKWIIGGKRKQLAEAQLDQKPVKDLIINDQQMKPTQLSMKQHWSKESFINKAFKNILKS